MWPVKLGVRPAWLPQDALAKLQAGRTTLVIAHRLSHHPRRLFHCGGPGARPAVLGIAQAPSGSQLARCWLACIEIMLPSLESCAHDPSLNCMIWAYRTWACPARWLGPTQMLPAMRLECHAPRPACPSIGKSCVAAANSNAAACV